DVALAQARGQRGARADGQAGGHDPVTAEDVEIERRDVYRAAQATAVAGLASHQLRHHPVDARALGDAVAMAAMVADDGVLLAQRRARPGSDRLLTDIGMRGAFDEAGLEQLRRLLVEAADPHHGPVEMLE